MKEYTEQDIDIAYEMGVKKGFQNAMNKLVEEQTGVNSHIDVEVDNIPLKVYYYKEEGCRGDRQTPSTPDSVSIEAVTTTHDCVDISPLLSKSVIRTLNYKLEQIILE